jgi:hypothetical protein
VVTAFVLVVAGVVLSTGPEGARWLYAPLYDHVFGFQAVRAPARFAVVGMLGLVVLAGFGLRALTDGRPARQAAWLGLVVLALMAAEYVNRPLVLVAAPPLTTDVGQWLADAPGPGAVVVLPLGTDVDNTPAMVQSLEHWRPLVNGYSGQRPSFFPAVAESLAGFPSPDALVTLKELAVRFVVTPAPVAAPEGVTLPLVERARFADGVIYEVVWTPGSEAALDAAEGPPPPGAIPFAGGETATYEVRWDGGPIDLPAGTATIRVAEGASAAVGAAPGARWTFEASAMTADWVSSFYEARDSFVTAADAGLLPLVHVRDLHEGRRELRRAYRFDAAARLVRIGDTPEAARDESSLALPLAEGARDALTAFFYVRTLALTEGDVVRAPLNEAGRAVRLELVVGGVERVPGRAGGPVDARRMTVRLGSRVERRAPPAITLWMSEDDRRIPLAVVVEAGFGRVRADLVHYGR